MKFALHVEDVLYRRTRIGLETRDKTSVAAQRVANVMGTGAWVVAGQDHPGDRRSG